MIRRSDEIRLVPRPLWGISLSALCTAGHWKRCAERLAGPPTECRFARLPGFHRAGSLHGHERWHYCGQTATLEGVWWLCATCHDIYHPGRVQAVQGDEGLSRVTAIYAERCGASYIQARDQIANAFARYGSDSRFPTWTVDLSTVPDELLPLRLRKGREREVQRHRWIGDPFAQSAVADAHG